MIRRAVALSIAACAIAACGDDPVPRPPRAGVHDVRVTEVASANPGGGVYAARDEHGDYDDWIELYNPTDHDVDLADLQISDLLENPSRYRLPGEAAVPIKAKSYLLIFADGETHQGPTHLPFSLSKDGESVSVSTSTGAVIAAFDFPAMREGQSWALENGVFHLCETPTPGADNLCEDKTPPPKKQYEPYTFSDPFPPRLEAPLQITELDVYGAARTGSVAWVELYNASEQAIELDTAGLYVTAIFAPAPIPSAPNGDRVALRGTIAPGEARVVELPGLSISSGVLLLFGPGDVIWDRFAYEEPQEGTIYAMPPDRRGVRLSCDALGATPGAINEACVEPAPRLRAPKMIRVMGSQADLDAMAGPTDETTSDASAVKFIIDRQNANTLYFVDSASWPLHFDWVWEMIEHRTPFDLCDRDQAKAHDEQWGLFSQQNYFQVASRRYFLGTLIHYRDSDLYTVELAAGDLISPEMIEELYFIVARNLWNGTQLAFRPTTSRLEGAALVIEGKLPIINGDVPFEGQVLQTLNPAVGYGVLELVEAANIERAAISYQTIVLLDQIPNELPPVGGSITEEFQTPLAHVNVLAQNRGTPNMAIKDARHDPRIAPFLGRLVRLEVGVGNFSLRVATSSEAETFWRERIESRPRITPPLDLQPRAIVDLTNATFDDVKSIGAKASQYAELMALEWPRWVNGLLPACAISGLDSRLPIPRPGFAIPFSRYREHLRAHDIDIEIENMVSDESLKSDPARRRSELLRIRALIEDAPIDPELLAEVNAVLRANFGDQRVRFRSSTNVEDLAGFNGAGLYESHSGQLDTDVRPIDEAIKKTWSSLWTFRGYEERALFGVDQRAVAMGVLIHEGTPNEEANGVAITRNVIAPLSHGFYINAQDGELSVVLPETGDLPEQAIYKMFTPPDIVVLARSTATGGEPVLKTSEMHRLSCALLAVHKRFAAHYRDRIPEDEFAVDVEWKLVGPERALRIKQARPWVSGARVEPTHCE